jgi:hypothetical protein
MDAPNNRPKFLRHYGRPVELRVEQIGPNLWCGSVYRGAVAIKTSGGTSWIYHWDDLFTALTEESDKHAVMAMVQNLRPEEPIEEWCDLSDVSEESWKRVLTDRDFPSYPRA